MFSTRVIEKRLDEIEKQQGWRPERLSVEASRALVAVINDLAMFNDEGEFVEWRKHPSTELLRYMQNEALLAKNDFLYASTHYAFIMDWMKKLSLFRPNIAQNIKLDIYSSMEELMLAIIVQALKARQLGSSTVDELIVWFRAMFWPYTNAIVGSSDPKKSAKMFQMVERAWKHTPFWLKPKCTKFSKGEFYDFDNIDSHISIQHGTQFSGLGRGDTPNVGHLSEICDYDDPKQLIDASLLKCLHEIPDAFLILESTANGRGDWWHEQWEINKENEPLGLAKMKPIFLPWFVGRDIYPAETWLRARPVPADWQPKESTVAHAAKAAAYVANTPLLRKHLQGEQSEPWVMPVEQMWWYEVERYWAVQKNELNIFLSECPANDAEAFQSKTGSIFNADIIVERRDASRMPSKAFTITGDYVTERLVAAANQRLGEKPVVTGHTNPNGTSFRWLFEPLRVDGVFDPTNKLCVWEMPKDGEQYEISIDTGGGIGQDRTVVQVGRRGGRDGEDCQVAEWCSQWAGALDMWPLVLAIGRLYTVMDFNTSNWLEPRITIELAANGEALQEELRKQGWKNFYIRRKLSETSAERLVAPTIGWTTSWTSRPKLLDHLIKVVRDGYVKINSPWLVDELADLQRNEKNNKIEAPTGRHDDRLMAFAIMCYVMFDLDPKGEPSAAYRRRETARQEFSAIPSAPSSPQSQPQAVGSEMFQWI